ERLSLFLAIIMLLGCIPSVSVAEALEKERMTEENILDEVPSDEEVKEEISEEKNWSELTETDKPDYLKMSDIEAIEESVGASAEGFEDLKVAAERDSEVEVSGDYSFTEPIVVENRTLTIRNSGPTTFRR